MLYLLYAFDASIRGNRVGEKTLSQKATLFAPPSGLDPAGGKRPRPLRKFLADHIDHQFLPWSA